MSVDAIASDPTKLKRWLTERIALYVDKAPDDLDPATPLAEIGMDSVYALCLCGDIEAEMQVVVEPTLAWDYPTIEAIVGHLTAELSRLAAVDPERSSGD